MSWYPDDIHNDGEYLCPDVKRKKTSISIQDFIGMVVIPPCVHMPQEKLNQIETFDLYWNRDREIILEKVRVKNWMAEYSFDKYQFDEYVDRQYWITQIDPDIYRIDVLKYFGCGANECYVDELSYSDDSLYRAFDISFSTFFCELYGWGKD